MRAMNHIQHIATDMYIIAVITVLGVFALTSAILISWPALAYLASKFLY